MTLHVLLLSISWFYLSIKSTIMPLQKGQKYRWHDLYNQLLRMQIYRQECRRLYQMQGFSKWRWYSLLCAGPLWMLLFVLIFMRMNIQERSFWVLVVGIVGWGVFLRLQIRRECWWCLQAGSIDLGFINARILQSLILYTIALYVFHTYGNGMPGGAQAVSMIFLVYFYTSISVFSKWLHLCLGQRRTPQKMTFWGLLWEENSYGSFGDPPPGSSPSSSVSSKGGFDLFDFLSIFIVTILYASLVYYYYYK
ncbi:hypothetical protein [Pasteuria penetrans]|uniref:hypothetical protein n=1 Tax=Pasteuria penetrans TaxID=86005 RepID=UPI0011ED7016|nr:hypothetical protein [Pasteuria penetrans]